MNVIERVAGTRTFLRLAPKFVPQVDQAVHRLTGGRLLLSNLYMPTLLLTTTGRKSGEPRTVPLVTIPHGDAFIVVGSNYGRDHHPAWSSNLMADAEATVEYRGTSFPVRARLVDDQEKASLWTKITRQWPNYDKYIEYSGRNLRVFVLERTGDVVVERSPGGTGD